MRAGPGIFSGMTKAMVVGLAVFALEASGRAAGPAPGAPDVPAPIRVPAGAKLVEKLHATGAQVYGCAATDGGGGKYGWTLKRPDATLADAKGAEAGKHGAGPAWTAKDGSSVTGAKVAQADAPAADAIPWLLLRATATTGKGRFSQVTFVQRLATKGGKAPATGCDAAHDGKELRVDYTADYYFFTGGASKPDKH
ncbi:MAG TPA: DUF3455 domain-containing protein [Polyangia bacterium]|jgi:hypothetical protein